MTTPTHCSREDSHARGMAVFNTILPDMPDKLHAALGPIAPDMIRFIIDVGGGDVLARPHLDLQAREVATIAALAAMGNAAPQLAIHMRAGMHAGLLPQQIIDILYLVAVFAGFPAALNAIAVAGTVFTELGADFTPAPDTAAPVEKRNRGLQALAATSGSAGEAVLQAMRDLAPPLADLLIDFSYGEVISRPHLSPVHKEICMIAAAAARGGMLPQLKVHVQAALRVGMSRNAIVELCIQMAIYAGFPAAINALLAVREVADV